MTPAQALEEIFRREHGLVLSSLIRSFADFDVAEEALAEAVASAVESWPRSGTPANPAAWLLTVARHKGIDRLRRRRRLAERVSLLVDEEAVWPMEQIDASVADERLRLIFTCCHPSLSPEGRVALTLRTLGGLATAEIARAFLTSEAAMFQRITRAKNKIRLAGIPYQVPSFEQLPLRLESVLAVVYLIFNEGYSSMTGSELVRVDLCQEAIRLAEMLAELLPDNADVSGSAPSAGSPRPGDGAGSAPRESWCCWPIKIAAAGTGQQSIGAWGCWAKLSKVQARVLTSSRPESPPCIPLHLPTLRPTGQRSSSSTRGSIR